jgi:TolB-like protein
MLAWETRASGGAYVAGGLKSAATVALQSAALPTLAEPAKRRPHLSIVVLPFANLSGDANQDYFADGITENLTARLSRLRGSFVIARNTAFTLKGRNVDAREIGKELGVRYVLEGSVQRDQSQVRVNAQLIDAENGGHLWADRFEGRLTDQVPNGGSNSRQPCRPIEHGADRRSGASGATGVEPRFHGPLFSGSGVIQQGPE